MQKCSNISQILMNNVNEIIFILDVKKHIIDLNNAAMKIINCSKDKAIGKDCIALLKVKNIDLTHSFNALQKTICTTETSIDNKQIAIKWTILPIQVENKANELLLIGSCPILELEKDFNLKIHSIIESIPGNHWWKDLQGVYRGCNTNVANSLGLQPKDMIGKTDYELPWAEQAAALVEHDNMVIQKAITLKQEEEATGLDGSTKTFLVIKVPLRDHNNNIIGTVGTSIDITAQKNAEKELIIAKEKAEAANEAKTQFIQNMQHDIRTPAIGMYGVLSHLVETENDPDRKEVFRMLAQASQHLLNLCNDVVEFGDIEHGKPVMEKMFDIREMAQGIFDLNKPAVFGKNVELCLRVDENIPPEIMLDPFRMQRILLNLLGNAIKFTEQGEVLLDLSAEIKDPRRGILKIEVNDTGIGFDSSKVEVIFEKFTRLTPSNTNKYPGTGLGLYVVKKFVNDLEGDLNVTSKSGNGSCFSLTLPFKIPLREEGKRGRAISEEFRGQLEKIDALFAIKNEQPQYSTKEVVTRTKEKKTTQFQHKVLLIEDDNMCLMAQKDIFQSLTTSVDIAQSLAEAIAKLRSNYYDLVVSDLGLPDGSGIDIVKWVKASPDCENYTTPFVALTAHKDGMMHQNAIAAGFAEVATKPLAIERAHAFLTNHPIVELNAAEEPSELLIIDLALAMERIGVSADKAIGLLKALADTIDGDFDNLKAAQERHDIRAIRDILHKVRGGFCYTGVPRLEKTCAELHDAVKATDDLKKIANLFDIVYEEVELFKQKFQEEFGQQEID